MTWRFSVGNSTGGNPSWWLYAENNERTAVAGETFASLSNAKRGCENFKVNAAAFTYDIYLDTSGQYRWRAKATNGAIVASAGEAFSSKQAATAGAERVRTNAPHAEGP